MLVHGDGGFRFRTISPGHVQFSIVEHSIRAGEFDLRAALKVEKGGGPILFREEEGRIVVDVKEPMMLIRLFKIACAHLGVTDWSELRVSPL